MHNDVMLNGIFRICLWLVARQLQKERFMTKEKIALCLQSSGNKIINWPHDNDK